MSFGYLLTEAADDTAQRKKILTTNLMFTDELT
jgi:hypothetical protein